MTSEPLTNKLTRVLESLKRVLDLAINNPHADQSDRPDIELVRKQIIYIEQDIPGHD